MLDGQWRFLWFLGSNRDQGYQGSSLSNPGRAVSVRKQAVMPDLYEAWRQDVQTEPAQELLLRESHGSELTATGIVFIAEGDRAVLQIQSLQAAVGDGNPVGVAAQIRQHGLWTGKGSFGINDPFVLAGVIKPAGKDDRLGEARLRTGELQLALDKELPQAVTELGSENL